MGFRGALTYEFRMQIRRPALWIVLLLTAAATVAGTRAPLHMDRLAQTPAMLAGDWAAVIQVLLPVAFGCLLADRVGRERRLRVEELAATLPATPGQLLLGKYLGAGAATALPIALLYGAGAIDLAATHGAQVLPWALAAFALVNLPGLAFVAAFSLGCPAIMPVALYQFLFVGYWFWGNFLSPAIHIPTISTTILTPAGGMAAGAFFHTRAGAIVRPSATATGIASVAVLVGLAALALWATIRLLAAQRSARGGGGRPTPNPAPASGSRTAQRLRYELLILGPSVLAAPLLVVGSFDLLALLTALAGGHGDIVRRVLTSAVEIGLSLGAGIAAANLVAAEPAAELHLALPRGYRGTALLRLAIATVWACALGCATSCILAAAGGWLTGEPFALSQLVWAAPILWMTALGAALTLAMRSRAGSVGVLAGIWVSEFIAHGLFNATGWLHPVALFATSFARGAPWWLANRLELIATAAVLFALAWTLLGNREAFVGSAQD